MVWYWETSRVQHVVLHYICIYTYNITCIQCVLVECFSILKALNRAIRKRTLVKPWSRKTLISHFFLLFFPLAGTFKSPSKTICDICYTVIVIIYLTNVFKTMFLYSFSLYMYSRNNSWVPGMTWHTRNLVIFVSVYRRQNMVPKKYNYDVSLTICI